MRLYQGDETDRQTDRQTEQNTQKDRERESEICKQAKRKGAEERWEGRPKKISMGSYCPTFSFIPILPRKSRWSIILYAFQFSVSWSSESYLPRLKLWKDRGSVSPVFDM